MRVCCECSDKRPIPIPNPCPVCQAGIEISVGTRSLVRVPDGSKVTHSGLNPTLVS